MDTFDSLSFPRALPAAESIPKTSMAPVLQEDPGIGAREARNRQWESLKTFIHQVYIEDDKPFPYLAKKLKEEHGFETTKKQFSRKIEQWGFRKNVSRSERLTIMRSLPRSLTEKPVLERRDRRIKEGKLRNWRKRYGEEVKGVSITLVTRAVDGLPQERTGGGESQLYHASETEETAVDVPSHPPLTFQLKSIGSEGGIDTHMNTLQDSWPFDWSRVDVPGSPGLSRLFEGLKIECETSIPPITLDTAELDGSLYLSTSEIEELFNEHNQEMNEDHSLVRSSKSTHVFSVTTSTRRPGYPYRDIEKVFCGYSPSPLNEIYVFPPSPPNNIFHKSADSGMAEWTRLEIQELELEIQFAKLKKQFPVDHPAVLAVMEDLSYVYDLLRRGRKTEYICRDLVDLYRQTLGLDNPKTLNIRLRLIQSIMDQRRFVEAQPLIRNLRYEAFQLVQPHDHLAINVAEAEAWLAEVLGNNDTSESLRRQILQITLASYGPKHWRAIFAMSDLGCAIPLWSTESGEILLRTAVQLSVEGSGRSADSTNSTANRCRITANLVRIMANLVKMLKHKGAHEESHNIATKTIDAFAPVLGATNQELLEVKYLLAWNVYKLGRLQESEEQFRALASLYPAYDFFKSDETVFPRNTLLNVWSGLADVLWDMGKGNEAASWLEKSFRGALSIGRANSRTTEDTCRRLGSCYEINGRYNDALKLYNQMIDEIRKLGNDHAGAIPQYESEISRIQDCMRGSTSSSIEETDDSDQSEWKSSNFQEEAELEVGAGCDEDNDAQMTVEDLSEKEGWKEFINED